MVDMPTSAPLVDAYRSPYTEGVLQPALKELDNIGQKRRNQLGTEAFGAGAYGDSRHGVESADLTGDMAKAAGELTAGVNADSWDKAMGWLNTDLDRQTSTAFNNANLENQWYSNQQSGLNMAQMLEQMGITNSQSYADALLGLDEYDRGNTQDQLNVDFEDWLGKEGWDENRLNTFLGFISGTPGQTGTSTTSTSPNNSWASMLGSALSGLKNTDGTSLFGG